MKDSNHYEDVLITNDDEHVKIIGYRFDWIKFSFIWLNYFTTFGILRLIFFWRPDWMLYCTHSKTDISKADSILLFDQYNQAFVEKVHELNCNNSNEHNYHYPDKNGQYKNVKCLRWIDNRKTRYIWNFETNKFEQLNGFDFNGITFENICNHSKNGLNIQLNEIKRRILFEKNLIEICIESIIKIFITQVLNPFYIYQFVAIIFWTIDHYYYYAGYIFAISLFSLIITTYQIRLNQKRLRDKVFNYDYVNVLRNKYDNIYEEKISSEQLLPGDVVLLNNQSNEIFCDMVLLSGEVIVNEAMLTGESNPVTKIAARSVNDLYDHKRDTKNILFCGTNIIQLRQLNENQPRAIVIRTGFSTVKGELVKSILFPKPIDFKFNRHINHFLFGMSIIAIIGFIFTIILKIKRNEDFIDIFLKAIDLISVVVPPELPAALTIAIMFVDNRLRKNNIFCMSPRSINISGCIDCVCFDKTGTLTEDNIDMHEVVITNYIMNNNDNNDDNDNDNKNNNNNNNNNFIKFLKPFKCIEELKYNRIIEKCLASCHTLKLLNNNQIIGEDLELKLFNWTKWNINEPKNNEKLYGYTVPNIIYNNNINLAILKQFPFNSNLARMSIILAEINKKNNILSNKFEFYIKGAPEIIIDMCIKESIPNNFNDILQNYTNQSYRVIAIAYKIFDSITEFQLENLTMKYYENNLIFLGLIVMRNNLKLTTTKTINILNNANIRSIMVTGDNLITALSVAKECQIISNKQNIFIIDYDFINQKFVKDIFQTNNHNQNDSNLNNHSHHLVIESNYTIAMTGKTFKILLDNYSDLLPKIMARCSIYARMAPEQKQQLVENLQSCGYYVAMCGDGANDCGALKVAHAGISLSDTEASVASAFTSLTGEIDCVIQLLREGRASLVSVFGIVRYMACYNITTFVAMLILYYYYSSLTDIQNLYQDIFIISAYCFLFGRTYPYHKLSPIRPPMSLMGIEQFSSIILQLIIVIIIQLTGMQYLHSQDWYVAKNFTTNEESDLICHDNYSMFIIQIFQYTVLLIIFSYGAPYRRAFFKNKLLLVFMIVGLVLTLFIVISPERPWNWIAKLFQFETDGFPVSFRWQIVGLVVVHFFIALALEKLIVERYIKNWTRQKTKPKYQKFYDSSSNFDWLPTSIKR